MPQKQPPAKTAVRSPLVVTRASSTTGLEIVTAALAPLQAAAAPKQSKVRNARGLRTGVAPFLCEEWSIHSLQPISIVWTGTNRYSTPSEGGGLEFGHFDDF